MGSLLVVGTKTVGGVSWWEKENGGGGLRKKGGGGEGVLRHGPGKSIGGGGGYV